MPLRRRLVYAAGGRAATGFGHSGGHARPHHRSFATRHAGLVAYPRGGAGRGRRDALHGLCRGCRDHLLQDAAQDQPPDDPLLGDDAVVGGEDGLAASALAGHPRRGRARGDACSKTVRHIAVRVPSEESVRAALLEDILLAYGSGDVGSGTGLRCIVFTETKREADELVASSSVFRGTVAQVLHGDVSQRQREATLSQFKMGRFGILVATDV
eukprot:ctg_606.g195